jgi:hypothetical protein
MLLFEISRFNSLTIFHIIKSKLVLFIALLSTSNLLISVFKKLSKIIFNCCFQNQLSLFSFLSEEGLIKIIQSFLITTRVFSEFHKISLTDLFIFLLNKSSLSNKDDDSSTHISSKILSNISFFILNISLPLSLHFFDKKSSLNSIKDFSNFLLSNIAISVNVSEGFQLIKHNKNNYQ